MAWRVRSTETFASDQLTAVIHCGAIEHLVAAPPIARVHDQVANRPGVLVDEEVLDVAKIAVGRVDVMSDRRIDSCASGSRRMCVAAAALPAFSASSIRFSVVRLPG